MTNVEIYVGKSVYVNDLRDKDELDIWGHIVSIDSFLDGGGIECLSLKLSTGYEVVVKGVKM
jgi:hypothetical protein